MLKHYQPKSHQLPVCSWYPVLQSSRYVVIIKLDTYTLIQINTCFFLALLQELCIFMHHLKSYKFFFLLKLFH